MNTEYMFNDLLSRAINAGDLTNETKELAEWFNRYDNSAWNGECYVIGDGTYLYPLYDLDKSDDIDECLIGWGIR